MLAFLPITISALVIFAMFVGQSIRLNQEKAENRSLMELNHVLNARFKVAKGAIWHLVRKNEGMVSYGDFESLMADLAENWNNVPLRRTIIKKLLNTTDDFLI